MATTAVIAVAGFRVASGRWCARPHSGRVNSGAWRPSPVQAGAHPCEHRRLRRGSQALWCTHRGTRMGLSTLSTLQDEGRKPSRHGVPTWDDGHCAQGRFPNERTGLNLGLSGPPHMVSLCLSAEQGMKKGSRGCQNLCASSPHSSPRPLFWPLTSGLL